MRKVIVSLFILVLSVAAVATPGAIADVELSPAGSFKAKTNEVKGEATLTGDTVTADNIVVKLVGLKTGISLRDKHATEKYLEVGKFPDAVLTNATGKGGKGHGKLKIRGIEKDVEGTGSLQSEIYIDFHCFRHMIRGYMNKCRDTTKQNKPSLTHRYKMHKYVDIERKINKEIQKLLWH